MLGEAGKRGGGVARTRRRAAVNQQRVSFASGVRVAHSRVAVRAETRAGGWRVLQTNILLHCLVVRETKAPLPHSSFWLNALPQSPPFCVRRCGCGTSTAARNERSGEGARRRSVRRPRARRWSTCVPPPFLHLPPLLHRAKPTTRQVRLCQKTIINFFVSQKNVGANT